jgi:dTDP-4-amino-4,6-dideoxygalactose transaminase
MITTKHKAWDTQFRLWRQHGMSASDSVRHSSPQVIFESYPELGFNYRMTDIQAAVGREQVARLSAIVARRRELATAYDHLLRDIPGLRVPAEPAWARSNWQSYCVRLPAECDQKETMQALLDCGIATRRGIMCTHREPAYQKQLWRSVGTLGCSEQAQDTCILLPLYPQMNKSEHESVACGLRQILAGQCVS